MRDMTNTIAPPAYSVTARALHWLTAVLVLAMIPLGIVIATSAYRAQMPMFGLFDLPPIWPVNRALSGQLFVVHRALGIIIAIVAVMHIGAALYHHVVRRDRVLMRMITG